MPKLLKIAFPFILAFSAIAQNDGIPYLDFSLRGSGSSVVVSWQVKAGNTCQDVQVWRGTDSLNLAGIYTYPGICGDNDSSKVYRYTDKPPRTGIFYYYRIVVIADKTVVKKILVPPESGLSLYPNPASEKLKIIYNPQLELNSIEFVNEGGKILERLEQPQNFTELDVALWPSGTYLYQADFNGKVEVGRVVIK